MRGLLTTRVSAASAMVTASRGSAVGDMKYVGRMTRRRGNTKVS